MNPQKPNILRNKQMVQAFLNLEPQVNIAKKFNVSTSRVNEILTKILGKKKMLEIKLKKKKMIAEKYKKIYLNK